MSMVDQERLDATANATTADYGVGIDAAAESVVSQQHSDEPTSLVEAPAPRETWLEELAGPPPQPSAKRQRTAPFVDASRLPPDSVRALVAARQATKIEAFQHALSARGEPPLELLQRDDSACNGSVDDDAIEREEKRIAEDESKFMATLKRIRQEERGIVNLPDKLKEVLKAQRAALTSKFSVSNMPPPSPGLGPGPNTMPVPAPEEAQEHADVSDEQGTQSHGDEDVEVHDTVCITSTCELLTLVRRELSQAPVTRLPSQLFQVGQAVYANDNKSGIYAAKVLKAEFNRKGFPDSWAYFVHFLGWKKSHDKWVPASNIVWRDASETVRAGQTLEITIWGDEPVVVETELSPGLDEMQDEESGNQWLYSCVMCGDGGDVAMCDACPRVYHHECLDKESNDRLKKVKRWFCPHCMTRGISHGTHRPKIAGQRPPIQHDATTIETLAQIGELCRAQLPEAVVGSQLEQIAALETECKAEDITISSDDVARMRDCAAFQRHMKVKLNTETVSAMIEALFTSFLRKGSKVLKKAEYASFVTHVAGYEKLTDSQWEEECTLVGASTKAGIDLEQFTKLYSDYGRKAREDYGKVFVLP